MSRVLVTGGAGSVGAAVVAALLDDGHEVRVLDQLAPDLHPHGWPAHLDARAERVVGDVRDLPAGVLDGVDVVSHQAVVVGRGVALAVRPGTRRTAAVVRGRWAAARLRARQRVARANALALDAGESAL